MALLLLLVAPSWAQVPLDENARYMNRFAGGGLGGSNNGGLAVGFRAHGVNSQKPRGGFVSGGDLEMVGDTDGEFAFMTRLFLGGGYLPTPQERVAVYTGIGVVTGLGINGESAFDNSDSFDEPTYGYQPYEDPYGYSSSSDPTVVDVDVIVPLIAEVGTIVTPTVGVHARFGFNLSIFGRTLVDGSETRTVADDVFPEFVVSTSVGRRQVARVRGLRIEAGLVNRAWMVVIGSGG